MHYARTSETSAPLTMKSAVGLALAAVASFHLAYARGEFGCFIGVYLFCLYALAGLPSSRRTFYNTAFVIDPRGEVVFRQAKCVPIQFFKDGLPALEQRVWDSPWGKIGFCICFDLSYRRVADALIRSGAQALIVPTMDLAEWGAHQHRLNARIAPIRAAEYGIPIFRLASSGISQGELTANIFY